MKKNIVSLILLSFFFSLYGQVQEIFENEVQISHVSSSSDVHVRANKYIQFRRGFSFDAQSQFELLAEIELKELALAEKNSMQGGPEGDVGALVGTDGVVGAIPGAFNVSPSGASTYTIPIECPPGINGMTPQVALSYSSQAGNGIAGWGWNISGTSAITRVSKNQYYDGIVKAIQWNDSDVFAFNGIRMFEVWGNADSKEYRLENDPTVKIIANDWTAGEGPESFTVWTGDGKVYYFGSNWKSKQSLYWDAQYTRKPGDILAWNISGAEDPYGNYLKYDYEVDSSTYSSSVYYKNYRIIEIDYTGNGTKDPFYKIHFNYQGRTDEINSYISLKQLRIANRLKEIDIQYESSVIKKYTLDYEMINGYSHLNSVHLSGMGEEYNKTVFSHNTETIQSTINQGYESSQMDGYEPESLITGDFNGDGRIDYCQRYIEEDGNVYYYYYSVYLSGNYNNSLIFSHKGDYQEGETDETGMLWWKKSIIQGGVITGDFNRDGADDFVTFQTSGNSITYKIFDLKHNEPTGNFEEIPSLTQTFNYKGSNFDGSDLPFYAIAEINGDGLSDLIIINSNPNSSGYHDMKLLVSNSTGYTKISTSIRLNNEKIEAFHVFDMNGDGLSDILVMQESVSKVSFNTGQGTYFPTPSNNIYIYSDDEIMGMGNFNGDNLIDLLVRRNGNDWNIFFNTGNGFFTPHSVTIDCEKDCNKNTGDRIFMTDFNNDGYTDFIVADEIWTWGLFSGWSYNGTWWRKYQFNGTGFNDLNQDYVWQPYGTLRTSLFAVQDFYADGMNDELFFNRNSSLSAYEFHMNKIASNCISSNLISKITNGLGKEIEIEYSRMIDYGSSTSIYTTTSQTHPMQSVKSPHIALVSTTYNGISTNSYRYHNGISAYKRGYLGIEKFSIKNDLSKIKTATETSFETTFYTPEQVLEKTYYNDTELLSQSVQSFDVQQIAGKRYLLKPDSQTSNNYKTGFVNSVMMKNHNFYGHPTRTIKKSWNGSTLDLTDSTELSIVNNIVNGNWFIGQIARQSVSKIRDETETVITNNYYNSSTGAPYLTYIHKNETNEVKIHYTYDNFGNIENITTSALNDPTILSSNRIKTTMNLYSSNGRFPDSTINPLGFVTSYLFDGATGLILSKTDEENSLTESYEYDGFGRKQRTIKKDGTEILTTLHWANGHTDSPPGAMVFKLIQKSGMADEYIFSDKHGRELRSVTSNFNGEKIYGDKLYNSKSQLWKESLPYSPGITVHYTEYTYDNYGRISLVDYPDDKFESFYYEQNYTRIKSGKGDSYRYNYKYTNSLGEVIRMQDSESKNVYTHYYPNGLPESYDYGNGYKIELEYDLNGNRTMISDPNAGSIISTYNAWGELLSQTDYRGNSTEYKYDILSRVVEEKQSSSVGLINTKTYTYDPVQFTGVLEKVSQTHRNSEIAYDYDNFGRITMGTEIYYIDDAETQSMTVVFEKEYDELGRVNKRIYPSGFEVNYCYNEYGDLKTINALGNNLWHCEEVNNLGQIIEYSLGNRATQIGYNSYGELQSMDLSNNHFLSYSFDDFGNMASRSKPAQYFNEVFEYDNMNRLTGSEFKIYYYSHPENDFVIEYDNNGFGNMVSKSDVGDFRYGEEIGSIAAGPHALTRIDNLVDYMPPNQIITYTSFNKVATIEEILPNDYVQFLEIDYGVDDQRRQSVYTLNDSVIKTKYFFGDYEEIEEDGITMAYHFIHSPTGLCAVYETEKEALTDTVPSILWHINTDHLGSIAYMEDASNSSSTKEYSFTAWGLSRDPGDWSELNTEPLYADRGFTGHEHLSEFNLINMNGRVYDPITARFLSPDPYVQMPGMRSGFNRYSYCLNNPLVYTDPDGEFIVEAILIGAFINTYIQGLSGNINSTGDFFLSMAVGGLSGLAGAGIGHVVAGAVGTIGFAGGALTGASGGFAGGFVGGAGNAWVGGASFSDGLKSGLVSGGIGAATGGLVGGISGGITASKNGGKFWTGKGARLEVLDNLTGDIIVGDGMEYSNEYARGFSDEHFRDAKGVDNLFADGSFPEGYTKSGDIVYNASKESIGGVTIYNGTGKGSNVYLFKTSFTSMEKLYINMGHEYIHAAHFYSGLHNINSSEEAAYKWSSGQSKAFNYSGTKAHYSMWHEYLPYANSSYSFSKFGFYILSTKPW